MKPVVSIIMATYNRAHFISEALGSIKSQTFTNWECLIIDDGGNDNTEEIVNDFIALDHRFFFFKRTSNYSKGLPGCRNQGLDMASGEYIIFFDDDDIAHPQNLEVCLKLINGKENDFCRYDKEPFFDLSFKPEFKIIKDFGSESFTIKDIDRMETGETPFASCSVMWVKECFKEIRFNEKLMFAEEWECYTRILADGKKGQSTKEILYYNRKHNNSNTGEFYANDAIRKESYVYAIQCVAELLGKKGLLSPKIQKFLIRLGFFLDDYRVISAILKNSKSGIIMRLKYSLGFRFYPIIRPIFLLKMKLKE